MSQVRVAVVLFAAMGLIGTPAIQADEPPAPSLWEGTIVGTNGRPAVAEVVAYVRPSGRGLDEGTSPLVEIARANTDQAGHYLLRSPHTDALRHSEDHDGWANVMVAAFGQDGSFNLAFDSLAWVPVGGFHAAAAEGPGGVDSGALGHDTRRALGCR
ncbi:MAG TPA: hypothetical protein VFE55_11250 [Acidimicrobiia bacterium]|nr:hypothetical protein [Acidimicrobiia bacterium]